MNDTETTIETGTKIAEHNDAWKGRGNLQGLLTELQRQKESKHDFVADVRDLRVEVRDGKTFLAPVSAGAGEWLPDGAIPFNSKAVMQLAEKANPAIPAKFFKSLLTDRPEQLQALVNGLHNAGPARRLVRCLDNNVRAWLSDSYKVIDHHDMAFTCLDVAQRNKAQVIEANITDTNMRIKFTTQAIWDKIDTTQRSGPQGGWFAGAIGNRELHGKSILGARITGDLPGGQGTVHPIVTVSNSETGHGGFAVRIGILMGICFNIATLEEVVTAIHIGSKLEEGIYSQSTIELNSKAIIAKAKDAIHAAFNQEKFKAMVALAQSSQSQEVKAPTAAVNNVLEVAEISGEHQEALLEYFLKDYDKTQFGLAQAVSRLAQDVNADDADVLEKLAGKIIKDKSFALVGATA